MNETEQRIATLLLSSIENEAKSGADEVKLYGAIVAYGQFLAAARTRTEVEAQDIDNKINSKAIQA